MTIISTTVGKNRLEEMEQSSQSTRESEMQYLDAISKTTGWSLFISKANYSISLQTNHSISGFSSNADEAEQFYEDLQDLLELITKKKMSFSL